MNESTNTLPNTPLLIEGTALAKNYYSVSDLFDQSFSIDLEDLFNSFRSILSRSSDKEQDEFLHYKLIRLINHCTNTLIYAKSKEEAIDKANRGQYVYHLNLIEYIDDILEVDKHGVFDQNPIFIKKVPYVKTKTELSPREVVLYTLRKFNSITFRGTFVYGMLELENYKGDYYYDNILTGLKFSVGYSYTNYVGKAPEYYYNHLVSGNSFRPRTLSELSCFTIFNDLCTIYNNYEELIPEINATLRLNAISKLNYLTKGRTFFTSEAHAEENISSHMQSLVDDNFSHLSDELKEKLSKNDFFTDEMKKQIDKENKENIEVNQYTFDNPLQFEANDSISVTKLLVRGIPGKTHVKYKNGIYIYERYDLETTIIHLSSITYNGSSYVKIPFSAAVVITNEVLVFGSNLINYTLNSSTNFQSYVYMDDYDKFYHLCMVSDRTFGNYFVHNYYAVDLRADGIFYKYSDSTRSDLHPNSVYCMQDGTMLVIDSNNIITEEEVKDLKVIENIKRQINESNN